MNHKYYSLQIIRGLAAWLIVFYHYMQFFHNYNYTSFVGAFFSLYGRYGVDIFFVLSGVVMGITITRNKNITPSNFICKRVIRVVPTYWFYTILMCGIIFLTKNDTISGYNIVSLIKSLLFIPNENVAGIGVFPILPVGWTLNLEIFFYFILFIMLFFFKEKALFYTMLFLIVLPFIWNKTFPFYEVVGSKLLVEFSLGIYIFIYALKYNINTRVYYYIIFVGMLMMFLSMGYNRYIGIFVSGFIIFGFMGVEKNNKSISCHGFLYKLGEISYSTYLCHIPIYLIAINYIERKNTILDNDFIFITFLSVIIYIVSCLSFKFIEKPFSNLEMKKYNAKSVK